MAEPNKPLLQQGAAKADPEPDQANSAPEPDQAEGDGEAGAKAELSDPLLQQAEDKLESGLTPENRQDYLKIVVAGMHLALAKGPNGIMASLAKSPDPVAFAAKGAIGLVLIMRKEAKGVMPIKAMVPAAMTIMFKALDFLDRSKIVPVGQPELVRATHIFTDFMFARMGITKQGLANAATKVHQITQDPQAMQKIQMKAGFLVHPDAATPTPLPPGPAGMINGGAGASGGAPSGLMNSGAAGGA
jgi:hypothetical protein